MYIGLSAVTSESAKLCPAYHSCELRCGSFRSELPVSALLLGLRFGFVYQLFLSILNLLDHGIVRVHDLRDFGSLINELRLEEPLSSCRCAELAGFRPSSASSEFWELVLRPDRHLKDLAIVPVRGTCLGLFTEMLSTVSMDCT